MKAKNIYRGFSLLDLSVAVLITACLLSISVPQIHDWLNYRKLKEESRKLVRQIESLSITAYQKEEDILLRIYQQYYQIVTSESVTTISLTIPVSAQVDPISPTEINIHPNGVHSPNSIILVDGHSQCQISIALRGRVRNSCV